MVPPKKHCHPSDGPGSNKEKGFRFPSFGKMNHAVKFLAPAGRSYKDGLCMPTTKEELSDAADDLLDCY